MAVSDQGLDTGLNVELPHLYVGILGEERTQGDERRVREGV